MKCFYLYYDESVCFDCGEPHREILGYYKGEPNKEIMEKLARKTLTFIDEKEFDKKVEITEFGFYLTSGFSKMRYETETFELKEID